MDQEVAKTLGELEIKLQELERELTSIGKRDSQPSKSRAPGRLIDEAVELEDVGVVPTVRLDDSGQLGSDARLDGGETAAAGQRGTSWSSTNLDDEQERAVDNAFGGPAVFGGEEVPAQGTTIERDSAFPVSETAYGEIATDSPQPPTASFPSGVFSPAAAWTPPPQPEPLLPPPGPPLPPPGPTPPSSPSWPPPPSAPPESSSTPQMSTPQPPPPPQPIDRAELVRFKQKLQRTMEELVDEYGKLLLPKPPA
jgi:hypothetical protein